MAPHVVHIGQLKGL